MAHYALLDENNIVINVIVGRDEDEIVGGVSDWESYYSEVTGLTALRTSYNTMANHHLGGGTPFRKNYAGIGFTYDNSRDAFIPPQPFASWNLNEETCQWDPPVPYPSGSTIYTWDEEAGDWVGVENETK